MTQRRRGSAARPGRHDYSPNCAFHHASLAMAGIAALLRLVGAVRRLAFDRNLPASEALGRIRDCFHEYDETRAGDRGE